MPKRNLMRTPVFGAVLATIAVAIGVAVGCQTYDFEPVQPLAVAQTTQTYQTIGRSLRPNMALLVDKSGSMNGPVVPGCTTACVTRWDDLKTAMSSFLSSNGAVARLGLAFFPSPSGGCTTTSNITVQVSQSNDVPSELQATADQIWGAIAGTTPSGGTPTASSVTYVADNALLADTQRDNFILLLTDGLPNCNPNNPYTYPDANCRCTDLNPSACTNEPKRLCLDADATVAAITGIRTNKNIRTIVVGFGADTLSGDGPATLQAMAVAGGFPRTCPGGTNAECGTGTCDAASKACTPGFYQAANATDLANVLANIAKKISQAPCDYFLAVTPSNDAFITVLVNGQVVPRGSDTWQYLPPGGDGGTYGEVQLVGALCTQARAATETSPVSVEIRLLKTF